jgi:NAD(P)-dependent dehydrogenase (short-subunit alcohol dehydrogenase family)
MRHRWQEQAQALAHAEAETHHDRRADEDQDGVRQSRRVVQWRRSDGRRSLLDRLAGQPKETPRMDRMKDKVVVVTGAAHGIGAAIAQRFADEGAVLALLDLDGAQLAETAKRLPGAQPLTIAADATDEAAVEDAFARIAAAHGRIDVLVNNVGGSRNQKLWEMTAEAWDFTIRLNLRSAFLCTRAALRLMMRQGAGTIVCMSSGAREGTPWTAHHVGGAAYSAAKAGIHGFIRDAAMELAEFGIRINAVAPGPVETERTARMFAELRETSDYSPHRLVPMRRIGQPREIADAVLFLASDEASYVTGTTLSVAGGR